MANGISIPDRGLSKITGVLYICINVTGIVRKLRIIYADLELKVANNEPNVCAISIGGGIRKIRKAIGNRRVLKICGVKITRITPEINRGNDAMWYSSGWKVYEPYNFKK